MASPARILLGLTLASLAHWAGGQSFSFVSAITDLGQPTGLSLDTVGDRTVLYVSDHGGGRVWKIDVATGARVQIGNPGSGNGQFRAPDAIAIDPATHDLYIPDRQLHRVTRLKNTGEYVMHWGGNGPETNRFGFPGAGSARGQFNGPQGAVVDAAGQVYITEHENHRVQKFRVTSGPAGWTAEVLAAWGSGGSAPGQFNTPYGITFDAAGNVWVADGFNSRLQRFTPNGEYLAQVVVRGPTEPHLVTTWLTFDAAGDLYVSVTSDPNTGGDIANQRIEKFSTAGVSLGRWGAYGSSPGQFRLPFGSAIDRATQRLYVADYDNGRVQVFALAAPGGLPPPPVPPTPPAPPPPTPVTPAPTSSLANVSSRLRISPDDPAKAAIAGFVIGGTTPTPILLRAVGPGLGQFGVSDALSNPSLQIRDSAGRLIFENDDWTGTPELSAATERVGAFRLVERSRDASLVALLPPGAYTAQINGGSAGIALVEVYDADATPAATGGPRVVNLSTRGFVDTGDAQLVAGFVVSGATEKRLLIRAVGPGLVSFGVNNALADPILRVFAANSSTPMAQNDNWEVPQAGGVAAAEIVRASRAIGAFALGPGSRDGALVVTVAPGAYTAVVSGSAGVTGVALVEIYEWP